MSIERPDTRARLVAIVGLIGQLVLTAFLVLLTVTSQSEAVRGLTLLSGVGTFVWLVLVLVYQQRVLVQAETLETEQLRRERAGAEGTGAIFDVGQEELLLAQRRLRWMYRWMLPAFSLVIILMLALAGIFWWSWPLLGDLRAEVWPTVRGVSWLTWCVGAVAFVSFLLSRYATGMAREPDWRMLRAGAAFTMGLTLGAAAVTLALGALHFFQTPIPERVVAQAVRILLLVLAAETLLNFILDFYRPRTADEEPRPAFDSRVLGLFTEPGGIARSIADALNYQFGFEVSSTWFYRLLQRSAIPLIGFTVITLILASSLVFVGAEERAVIERFGEKRRELAPGLHVKWIWPVEMAYKVSTARVHELRVGASPEDEEAEEDEAKKDELILWTNQHADEPHLVILAPMPQLAEFITAEEPKEAAEVVPGQDTTPAREGISTPRGQAVPVSILRVAVVIQYQIRDAYDWLRRYAEPEAVFEAVAKREILHYCANVEALNLLGGRRGPIETALTESIQREADRLELGIDIVFLGLQGVHPPSDTAKEFQAVIGAESKRIASRRTAEAESNRILAEAAGNVERARTLAAAIEEMNRLEADPDASQQRLNEVRQQVARGFFGDASKGIRPVGGEAAELIVQARESRWQDENEAYGRAVAFEAEMATKNAAPKVYYMRRYLEALAEALPGVRKYVMATEGEHRAQTFHLNLQDSRITPLSEALEQEE